MNLVIIGAGPGGYTAAFLAADLGMQVTLIDRDNNPGGVCLRRGCIPSKSLLHASRLICDSREAPQIGVQTEEPHVNLEKLCDWKNNIITQMAAQLGQMCARKKIRFIQGRASFSKDQKIVVKSNNGEEKYLTYDKVILAAGSKPLSLTNTPSSSNILNSTNALDLLKIPNSLLVIGGGYIGLELGKVYTCLGSKVTVIEMMPQLLPGIDRDLTRVLTRRLQNSFHEILLETKVTNIEEDADEKLCVSFQDKKGDQKTQTYDNILVTIGRTPNVDHLGLDNTSVRLNEKNLVQTDADFQTHDPNVYAIGDLVQGPMLAHKAIYEAHIAVHVIAGKAIPKRAVTIPAVVYTDPEITWCGLTETEAKEKGLPIKTAKLPWSASGRAATLNRTDGLTKIIIDPESRKILGMGIVGIDAGELISEGVLAIEMGATVEDLKNTIHPHPTLSETIQDCAKLL